ncbi:MAG: hypothetical protein JWN77_2753 [Frankiales bacterium]|jgi:hypothetical protein|nr:hypothetical protein [Frankiales bacterium]
MAASRCAPRPTGWGLLELNVGLLPGYESYARNVRDVAGGAGFTPKRRGAVAGSARVSGWANRPKTNQS